VAQLRAAGASFGSAKAFSQRQRTPHASGCPSRGQPAACAALTGHIALACFPTQVTGGFTEGGLAEASGEAAPGGAGGGGGAGLGGGGADKEKPSRGGAKRGRDCSKLGKAGN
jgi:hypothetical protein